MSPTSLRYDCLACRKEVYPSIPVVPPAQWDWRQRQAPRVLCPDCGCACAPYAWRLVALGRRSLRSRRGGDGGMRMG